MRRTSFKPHAVVNMLGKCLQIHLEDVQCHHEWIKGEGGDISLARAEDNNRIVGAVLPLYLKNSKDFRLYVEEDFNQPKKKKRKKTILYN